MGLPYLLKELVNDVVIGVLSPTYTLRLLLSHLKNEVILFLLLGEKHSLVIILTVVMFYKYAYLQ